MNNQQAVTLHLNPVTTDGQVASVEDVEWSVSDPLILEITPADDGMSAFVVALGPLGACSVTAEADSQIGAGTSLVLDTFQIEVVAAPVAPVGTPGQAVDLVISAGTPGAKPPS
jgi:hypothetical protein